MEESGWYIYIIGFLAQGFFSARILVQWIKSEKAKKLVAPALYWVFSLIGSYLMFWYGWLRDDFSIILGQFITYYIYIWNLNSQGLWKKIPLVLRCVLDVTPIVAAVLLSKHADDFVRSFLANDSIPLWLIIFGSVGQVIFTLRFVYQWFYSVKRKMSSLPVQFWIISVVGSGMIIIYAIIRKDPVLILGQIFGFMIYCRNIAIGIKAAKKKDNEQAD